ncbi:hypothetical protein [Jejuia pallidilutea]|jgi:isocitrate dehydrogenase kinase/phosphatase|uniref:STAS/SEC14 domain-containing protein n=1 Tax=Jejuia pallidilutea TaxID=504487 RepID=A0A090WNG0_9FLAO|nr:hypothetical protein [Jejuia pallidilutea]GAL68962.1 hypothetical protein JCM19301_2898 [Jejuia pallidilutea]GAL73035.1 hypothetical protein JCM19302_3343 [Jejuia pallidilutea]GAL89620.1 hypothetical protein JCM19538_1244 [Jejuia pallidilutea]
MKFEKSPYFKTLKPYKLELNFGNYYFCEKFIVSELFEGVHFDWDMVQELIQEIYKFYGEGIKLGYIANRVNAYSIDPQNWLKIEKKYNILVAAAIVVYNNATYINASLEKLFTQKSIKRCLSLKEAVEWIESLEEFN